MHTRTRGWDGLSDGTGHVGGSATASGWGDQRPRVGGIKLAFLQTLAGFLVVNKVERGHSGGRKPRVLSATAGVRSVRREQVAGVKTNNSGTTISCDVAERAFEAHS